MVDPTSHPADAPASDPAADTPVPDLSTSAGMTGAIYAAIDAQRPVAASYVRSIRRRRMDSSPDEVVRALERHYVVAVTASGSAVGASAFIPGAGTGIALGAGAAEFLLQFELAALFGLAKAEIHGFGGTDRDRARALILSLMLGEEGRNEVVALIKAAIKKDAKSGGETANRIAQLEGGRNSRRSPARRTHRHRCAK